jgi:transcriptional regulator with XRE-family HTH domain
VTPESAFGQVLREVRKKTGLSQEKLALAANLDRTFVSLLERGLRQPSLTTLLTLASVLEVPAPTLLQAVLDRMRSTRSG